MNKGVDYTGVCVVFFCHDRKERVLMAKRSQNCRDEKGKWDIGGGGVDFGEKVEEALAKEIREEYCTEIIDYEFLGYRDVHRLNENNEKTHWIALDFKVLVNHETVKIGEEHKFDDIGWFDKGQYPEPMHSQLGVFLEKYDDKI